MGDLLYLYVWYCIATKGVNIMGKYSEIVFILDRSGSMHHLTEDTIGGFNSMLMEQKELEGKAVISTFLFNHEIKILHSRVDVKSVKYLTTKDYVPQGLTALYDAIGKAINRIRNIHDKLPREELPNKVLFVVSTDGYENSSIKYSVSEIKSLIELVKFEREWEFLFLGANIDVEEVANKMGLDDKYSSSYKADKEGVKRHYKVLNKAIMEYRCNAKISPNWDDDLGD